MHKVRVFLNQRSSSQSRALPQIETLKRKLFRSSIDFIVPQSIEELKLELQRAIDDKIDVVVSVGGDGTVNTLIQTLGASETAFLVIPAGTANDLAREMGLDKKIDRAIDAIRSGEPERIDLIRVNQRYMATNGGLGIASEVAETVNVLRDKVPYFKQAMSLLKGRIYSLTLGAEVLIPKMKSHWLRIESEGFQGEVRSPLIMINNQPALGGHFRIAPETANNDGTFNVSLFRHTSKWAFLKALAHIRYHGRPLPGDPDFITFESREIKITTAEALAFYGDGETFEKNTEYHIQIVPRALKVYSIRRTKGRPVTL